MHDVIMAWGETDNGRRLVARRAQQITFCESIALLVWFTDQPECAEWIGELVDDVSNDWLVRGLYIGEWSGPWR
jgi:hypothetical protein